MEIITSVTLYELVVGLGSLLAGGFALFQWRQGNKLKRTELVKEASSKIREDEEIASVLYAIDYGQEWYCEDFLDNHSEEQKFDKAFAYFDIICYLKQKHIISRSEFRIFEYRLQRMAYNESFVNYFYNLYHFSRRNGKDMSFYYLLRYMKKNKLLGADFENEKSDYYVHLLNF